MTTGERLRQLAGTGGAAGALLLLIGSGSTAGAALTNYSQLSTGTAAQHILADKASPAINAGGGGYYAQYKQPAIPSKNQVEVDQQALRIAAIQRADDEMLLEFVMMTVTQGILT